MNKSLPKFEDWHQSTLSSTKVCTNKNTQHPTSDVLPIQKPKGYWEKLKNQDGLMLTHDK